ncbi:hypothetical protein B7494_g318 [Chlorociboria aeruginascens]|nr:hypothetical protein B7494_g318 [Chlorociboria aeruginascens]
MMRQKSCLVVFSLIDTLITFSYAITPNGKTCYAPNGTAVNNDDFQPCIDIVTIDSMCCATNRATNQDTCQTNGLCLNLESGNYLRDFCTDPTWSSPNCLPQTTCNYPDLEADTGWITMTQCPDGTWCCGVDNSTCCESKAGFELAQNLITFNTPTATTSPDSANETVTATTTATVTATVTPKSGEDVELGLGVGLGALAILGSLGSFLAGLWRGKKMERITVDDPVYKNNTLIYGNNGPVYDNTPSDLTSHHPIYINTPKAIAMPQINEIEGTQISELRYSR